MRSQPVKVFLSSAAVLAAMLLPVRLDAQVKVAVVDFQQALLDTAEMKKAAADLETKFKPRQDEIDKISQELEEIRKKLQTAQGAEAASLQNEAQWKQRQGQRLTEDLQADLEFERNEILREGSERMRAVIEKLAAEKGLDLIVDVSNTIFFKPALDVTAEAAAAYNQAHPVGGP